jgi:hypothetical protein
MTDTAAILDSLDRFIERFARHGELISDQRVATQNEPMGTTDSLTNNGANQSGHSGHPKQETFGGVDHERCGSHPSPMPADVDRVPFWFASFLPFFAPGRRACARLRFRAAIKSITGDGVDTARGSMVTPFIFASNQLLQRLLITVAVGARVEIADPLPDESHRLPPFTEIVDFCTRASAKKLRLLLTGFALYVNRTAIVRDWRAERPLRVLNDLRPGAAPIFHEIRRVDKGEDE